MTAWRREPPTVDEVRACRWWWVRLPRVAERVVRLTVHEDDSIYVYDGTVMRLDVFIEFCGVQAEYAPCLPAGRCRVISDPIYPRNPGCNVWIPTGGGWGWRCGDRDTEDVTHLCGACTANPHRPVLDQRIGGDK